MELQKVIFSFGRNDIYDYYILEEKKDAIVKDIEKDTLAFKIGGPGKIYISNFGNIKSLDRYYNGRNLKGKPIKLSPNKFGYLRFD